jgi:hypothetical protein
VPPTVTGVSPSSGPETGGTVVAVSGTGFAIGDSGQTTVDFGSKAGSNVDVTSATSLTVTVPAGSGGGAVPVSVTTFNGGTSTTDGSYTYNSGVSSMSLTKSTTSTGFNATGQTIPYTYLVTNTGTTTLTGITVSDNKNSVTCPTSTLATTDSETCTGSYTTTSADVTAGSVTNTATAHATGPVAVSSNSSSVTVSLANCDPPIITSGDSTTVVAGTPFDFTVDVCSNAVPALKAIGFPKGVVLSAVNDGTATLSGTISEKDAGVDSAAEITATVKGQAVTTQDFTMTVDSSPAFTSKDADLVDTGTAFSFAVTTLYGYPTPSITTSSTLPGGVTLVDNGNGTATLSGTPDATAGGVYTLTIVANNGIGSPVDQTFTLTVYQAPTVSLPASDTVTVGTAMTPVTVDDAGYPAPALKAKGLPKGLSMVNNDNGTATISGTPLVKDFGPYTVTESATSKAGSASQTSDFTVDSSPFFTSKDAYLATTGTPFSFTVTTVYGYPAPSITTSSTLPGGVTLVSNGDGTGTLSGTPDADAGGVYTLTIAATNGVGSPVDQTFTLTVYQAPTVSLPSTVSVTPGVAMTPVTVDYTGYPAPALKASGLPKGLSMVDNGNGTATISGTPSTKDAAGPATVTVTASSKAGTATATSSFEVS